jgi:hypothetical protein
MRDLGENILEFVLDVFPEFFKFLLCRKNLDSLMDRGHNINRFDLFKFELGVV